MKKLKQVLKRIAPVLLAIVIVFGTVASDYETAQATGLEEMLYYTYWDLISSLFVAQGYDVGFNVDTEAVYPDRVSGKQVWEHFCYEVQEFWKTATGPINFTVEQIKAMYEELCSLPEVGTQAGITMSQDLWDALRNYAEWSIANNTEAKLNFQQNPSLKNYLDMMGLDYSDLYSGSGKEPSNDPIYVNNGFLSVRLTSCRGVVTYYFMSIGCYEKNRYITSVDYTEYPYYSTNAVCSCGVNYGASYYKYFKCYMSDGSLYDYLTGMSCVRYNISVEGNVVTKISYSTQTTSCITAHGTLDYTFYPSLTKIPAADTVSITATPSACPAEVPEVVPWTVSPAIPDGWRVVQPNEDPEQDPDELPAVIPISPDVKPGPDKPKDPDGTENPDSTEDPGTNKPAVPPHPGIQINPNTGNEIDPITGYDIDPKTGYLIQPGTGYLIHPESGNLIDPDTGEVTDPNTGEVISIDPVVSGMYGDITKLFPFCIPFDIISMIKGMQADKAPPVFHFEYYFASINYTFEVDVDLSDYDKYIRIFRFGMQIFWVIALMFLTVKVSSLFI